MDTSKPSHALGITRYQLYCTLAASLGSFNFGWVMSATNLPGDIISKCTSIVESHSDKLINGLPVCLPIGDTLWGLVVGSFALGALIGAIACTRFSNMYGRRTVLLYSNVISIIGALLGAFALNPAMLAASRVLAGIGTGAANGTFTTYVVEITTPRARSSLGSMTQMAIILGILA
ncbi:Bifunctional purine biosynthesis protein PurH, partial [Coemansia sp. Benny D115]